LIGIGKIRRDRDLEYPQENNEEEPEVPWYDKPVDKNASKEQLIEQIEQIQLARKRVPNMLLFKQATALIYLVTNLILLYWAIGTPVVGYIAIYLAPISIVLMDYLLIIRDLKKKAIGEQ